ncbi:MAG: PD40 domain-containing protein, partial [Ktedonobacteraceae bacterium]|nr:PD40 domain-containing protein [Ktedonobacteraceae bacterium]
NRVGFNGLAWSPDSTRVASSTVEGVQIWDATTGKHLVNVPLSSTTGFPYGLAWSPNSQSLAVVTNQKLLIVDGKTGAILHTYSEPAASVNTATHDPYLATLMPASGGTGFRAVTWSPDGRSIAAAVSTGAQGHIQVLNAQTLTPAYTLQLSGNYVPGALAWSPDGQYLAAGVFNTQPGGQTVPPEQEAMIWAWNLSTHQLVFQKPGDSPAFQPKTHNLAFLLSRNGSSSLEIWDLASGKQLKHYQNHQITGSGTLAWSPDGRHLAYAEGTYGIDSGSTVTIMDIDNGRSIYTYMGHHLYISQLAWSPNGKYIVSAEGQTSGPMVAKVWTAG